MKFISKGETYDTEDSKLIGMVTEERYNLYYYSEELYKASNSNFFLIAKVGYLSECEQCIDDSNKVLEGGRAILLTKEDVNYWMKSYLDNLRIRYKIF